jgi:hypothetical protein
MTEGTISSVARRYLVKYKRVAFSSIKKQTKEPSRNLDGSSCSCGGGRRTKVVGSERGGGHWLASPGVQVGSLE